MTNEKVFALPLEKVYALLVAKAERKGRTRAEVDQIITWLTGYDAQTIAQSCKDGVRYGTFLADAPRMHPDYAQITGVVCGVRVEEIADPLMRRIRCLDKLVDELAKGRPMEKILRS